MGNVIGEPFKDYVSRQIKKRQEIHGKKTRTPEEITYLNSTLAWVKLASSVSLTQERLDLLDKTYKNSMVSNINPGKDLAMNNVLFNGLTSVGSSEIITTKTNKQISGLFNTTLNFTSVQNKDTATFNQQQRTGFLGPNGAYGVGGTDFGIVPMPGIVSVDSEDLNRGSIKKSRVKIKAYNKEQFDVIDVLYLRLGYTVLLEFGNSLYWDSGGRKTNPETGESNIVAGSNELEKTGITLIDTDFFRVDDNYYDLLIKIENNRENYRGNYDAILGKISNFSWTFSNDGTYDIDLDIISIGDVIESLKVNLPPIQSIGDQSEDASRQAALSQFKTTAATDLDDFEALYPGLIQQLEDWWNDTLEGKSTNPKENIRWYLAGDITSDLNDEYADDNSLLQNIITDREFSTGDNDEKVNDRRGVLSVHNIPFYKDSQNILLQSQVNTNLYNAIKFGLIAGLTGFYGGDNFKKFNEDIGGRNFLTNPYKDQTVEVIGLNYDNSRRPRRIKSNDPFDGFRVTIEVGGFIRNTRFVAADSLIIKSNVSTIQELENFFGTFNNETYGKRSPDIDDIKANHVQANRVLLNTIGFDRFLQKVFEWFGFINALGGTKDNSFKETPTFSSFSQELEYEKNKDRIHSWFYRVRKYYTGITSKTADLYEIKDLEGNVLKEQKPGQIFGPITINGDNSGNGKIKIGKILNPFDISKNFKDETQSFQKALIDKWASTVGFPNYKSKSDEKIELETSTIDFFVLDSFKKEVGGSGDFNLTGDGRFKFFVKLKVLLEFIEEAIIPDIVESNKPSRSPLLKIDTDSNSNICYTIDNVVSTDIKKCIVRNDKFVGYKEGGIRVNKLFEGIDYFIGENSDKTQIYGRPMNIYLNFEFVQNLIDDIKGKTGNAVLFDFLKNICDGINSSLGNVNNLEPIIDQSTNTIKIIDQTPIPNLPQILSSLKDDSGNKAYPNFTPNDPAILELYGYNGNSSNFVHNIGLTTTISKRYASMITIGATANGAIPGSEATAFSRWNTGVIDRIKPEIIDGGKDLDNLSLQSQNAEVAKRYLNFLSINGEDEQFKVLGLSKDGSFNDVYMNSNPSIVSDYYNYAQSLSSQTGSLESSVGFLPFNLKIDMEGISGMKIYNRLNVDTRFLPSNYPETLDFIITKVNHSLKNNVWKTTLDTQATKIIEDKKDNKVINTFEILTDKNTFKDIIVSNITQEQRDAVVTPPEEYTGTNGNRKLLEKEIGPLVSLTEIGFSASKLAPEAAKWFIIMWKDMKKAGLFPTISSTFRTYKTQYEIFDIDLFITTGGSKTNRSGKGVEKKKKGTSGKVRVAYPGTSNHGWGIAVDIGPRKVQCWMKENGVKYGWSWYEGRAAKEDWHFTYVPGLKQLNRKLPPTPVNQVWSQSFKGNPCKFKTRLIPAKEIKNEDMKKLIT